MPAKQNSDTDKGTECAARSRLFVQEYCNTNKMFFLFYCKKDNILTC